MFLWLPEIKLSFCWRRRPWMQKKKILSSDESMGHFYTSAVRGGALSSNSILTGSGALQVPLKVPQQRSCSLAAKVWEELELEEPEEVQQPRGCAGPLLHLQLSNESYRASGLLKLFFSLLFLSWLIDSFNRTKLWFGLLGSPEGNTFRTWLIRDTQVQH